MCTAAQSGRERAAISGRERERGGCMAAFTLLLLGYTAGSHAGEERGLSLFSSVSVHNVHVLALTVRDVECGNIQGLNYSM